MRYQKGFKYQLTDSFEIETRIYPKQVLSTQWLALDTDGLLSIERGYAWDGASGPTFDTDSSMTPALVHDALYQLIRLGLLDRFWRIEVDAGLRRMAVERGMWRWRARVWQKALEMFGSIASSPRNTRKIYDVD